MKYEIIAGRTLDDIAAAEVLYSYLQPEKVYVSFPSDEELEIRFSNAINDRRKLIVIGHERSPEELAEMISVWDETPPCPILWSRTSCSSKYVLGSFDGKQMRRYVASLQGMSLTMGACSILSQERKSEKYKELSEWWKSASAVLLPKVRDANWLFMYLAQSNISLKALAEKENIEDIVRTETEKADRLLDAKSNCSEGDLIVLGIEGKREALPEIVTQRAFNRGYRFVVACTDISAGCKNAVLENLSVYHQDFGENLSDMLQAILQQITRQKRRDIKDYGNIAAIQNIKLTKQLTPGSLITKIKLGYQKYREEKQDKLRSLLGSKGGLIDAGYRQKYGVPEEEA